MLKNYAVTCTQTRTQTQYYSAESEEEAVSQAKWDYDLGEFEIEDPEELEYVFAVEEVDLPSIQETEDGFTVGLSVEFFDEDNDVEYCATMRRKHPIVQAMKRLFGEEK